MAYVVQYVRANGKIQYQEDIYGTVDDVNEGARTFKTFKAAEASARRMRNCLDIVSAEPKEVRITLI